MGQTNQNILANQQSLSKMFALKGKSKQHNITYLEHLNDHKPYVLREATYNLQKEQQEAIARIKHRQHFNSPNLTNLIRYETSKEEGLCSKYFRLLSLWDYPRKTLAEENNERALSKQPYNSEQIRTLLRQVSQGLLVLQRNRISHQCLTSKSILVEQPLKFRVVDPVCLGLHSNLQQIYHKRSLKNIYLSPEQCVLIDQQNITQTTADPYREDVFTAGMLVLQSGLLQRQDDCYEEDCARVNWQQLEQNLNRFQERYGPQLRTILGLMLTRQKSKRIDWEQLVKLLENRQMRVSQVQSTIPRVSIGPQPVRGVPLIQHNVPIVTRTSYSPQAVRSTFVPVLAQPVQNLSPTRVVRQISPPRVVQVRQQQNQMRGSYIFSYQNNPQKIVNIETSGPRTSLPVQNRTVIYQNRAPLTSQVRPVTYTSYQPAPSHLVQHVQISAKATKPTPPTHTEVEQSEFKINSPTILEKSTQKELTSFELNQIEPVYVIQEFKNGSKYQGYKYKGKREGWGKYQYQEGGYYQGEWKNDLMSGKGKLYYESGKIAYDGHLEQDLFHGSGTLYNELPETLTTGFDYKNFQEIEEFWVKYEGQFRNDKKQGHGLLLLTNGQSFEGSFHDDKVQGEGVYRTLQGREIRGIWHQNKLQRQL